MRNRILIIVLAWTVMLTGIGCRTKEAVKSKMYSVDVKTWSIFGPSFEAFMYNTDLRTYPPERRGGIQFEENTLYILRHEFKDDQTLTDTLAIRLSNNQVDSLFTLAHGYLSEFKIDNEVEIGKVYESIQDGANLKVALGYEGKLMECSQYRLKGVSQSSVGGPDLIEFINSKVSEKFRLY